MTRAHEAFELLRAANPVPPTEPRKRWRRGRVALVLAALALCLLIVAPAVGIEVPRLDFWKAEKAPPKVVQDFETLSEGAPPGMDPGAIPGETRKVRLPTGQTLWVAPTRHGGLCTLGGGGGGCDKLGTVPLNVSWSAARFSLEEMTRGALPPATIFDRISGHVNGEYADAVEIRFADGDTYRLELAWVSEPIDVGFFDYVIPAERRRVGHEIESVVALDADGGVVTQDDGGARTAPPSLDALVDEKQAAARLATSRGEVVIWKAPTRYEGRCTWLEFHGRETPLGRCLPKGYEHQVVLSYSVYALGGDVVLVGACGYSAVELLHRDGSSRTVACRDGLVIAKLRLADAAGELRAIDAKGHPLPGSRGPVPEPRAQP
jgi:hypothetical protein